MADSTAVRFTKIENSVQNIERTVNAIKGQLEAEYVTKADINLMKRDVEQLKQIVFGFVSLVLVAFAGSVIAYFIRR